MEDGCGVVAGGSCGVAAGGSCGGKKSFQFARSLTYSHHQGHRPGANRWRRQHQLAADEPCGARPQAVVLYTTSLRGVRRTFTDCSTVRAILRGFRVAVDEWDVSMDAVLRAELRSLLAARGRALALPQLFPPRRRRGRGPAAARSRAAPAAPGACRGPGPGLRLRRLRRRPVRLLPWLRRRPQGLRRGGRPRPPLRRVQRERIGTLRPLLFLIAGDAVCHIPFVRPANY